MNKRISCAVNNLIGDSLYNRLFLLLGVIMQVIAYNITPEGNWISLFSGITGIFAVVLCAQRNVAYYIFAWPQLISYVWLAFQQRLWGEIYENIFYAVTMIIGMIWWLGHIAKSDSDTYKVESRKMRHRTLLWLILGSCIAMYLLYRHLYYLNDTQPLMDSITTVPAFVAQVLLTFRYREQWLFWLILNVGSIFMWYNAGDCCMVAQFIFWTINACYGYIQWSKRTT